MIEGNVYRLNTDVEPFMMTQRENQGYTTSYAQIRIHNGTHVDFPPHVGLEGEPQWNLSGSATIVTPEMFTADAAAEYDAILFETGGTDLSEAIVDALIGEDITLVGTDSHRVGDYETHRRVLGADIVLAENLINLDEPERRRGYLYCFPTLIEGCDDGAVATVLFETGTGEQND